MSSMTETYTQFTDFAYEGKLVEALDATFEDPSFLDLYKSLVFCSAANTGKRRQSLDPIEEARGLQEFVSAYNSQPGVKKLPTPDELMKQFPRKLWNEADRYVITAHEVGDGENYTVHVQGDPDVVAQFCASSLLQGHSTDRFDKHSFMLEKDLLSSKADQCAAFASVLVPRNSKLVSDITVNKKAPKNMCYVGQAALSFPPRRDTFGAVSICRGLDIKVFGVSLGDPHPVERSARLMGLITYKTALSSAGRPAGITKRIDESSSDEDEAPQTNLSQRKKSVNKEIRAAVLPGDILKTDKEWSEALGHEELVLARMPAEHCAVLIQKLREQGHTVGYVGTGPSDATALEKADLGIYLDVNNDDGVFEQLKQHVDIRIRGQSFASVMDGISGAKGGAPGCFACSLQ